MNILYCRKSSESEDRQVLSIESQITELSALAEKQNLKIDKVITESMSAKEQGRPKFNQMIKLIEQKKNCILFVWKLDRLARNPIDEAYIKHFLQKGYITEIKTPFGNYYPSDNVLMMSVEFGMANQYIRDLSTNVKRGNKTKLEKGGWPGNAPVGYLNDRANKTVYPDPAKARFIQKIFELYATGAYSMDSLAKTFYEQGFRSRSGHKIHTSGIQRILLRKFYFGVIRYNGKLYKGSYEPIISQTLFEQANAVLSGKTHSSKQKLLFPLRGFMTCEVCSCLITAEKHKGHAYYHCTNGKKICTQKKISTRSEKLDDQVAEIFDKIKFDEDLIEMMYLASKRKHHNETESQLKAIGAIRSDLSKLTQKRSRLADLYINEQITEEAHNAKNLALNNDEVLLTNQLTKLEKNFGTKATDTIEQTKKAFLQANIAQKDYLDGNDPKKYELAKILLSNLKVRDQKVQSYQLKMPYQIMLAGYKNTDFFTWQGL